MSRPVRQAAGDLVRALSDHERGLFDRPRGAKPRAGTSVTLWRLAGTWHVWSPGPEPGTWWVRASDAEARHLVEALTVKPDRGMPVARHLWRDCAAVSSREIRPAALSGARRKETGRG